MDSVQNEEMDQIEVKSIATNPWDQANNSVYENVFSTEKNNLFASCKKPSPIKKVEVNMADVEKFVKKEVQAHALPIMK